MHATTQALHPPSVPLSMRFHNSSSWRVTLFQVHLTVLKISAPLFPISRSAQSFEFVSFLTLLPNTVRGYLDIPAARVFSTSEICFAI